MPTARWAPPGRFPGRPLGSAPAPTLLRAACACRRAGAQHCTVPPLPCRACWACPGAPRTPRSSCPRARTTAPSAGTCPLVGAGRGPGRPAHGTAAALPGSCAAACASAHATVSPLLQTLLPPGEVYCELPGSHNWNFDVQVHAWCFAWAGPLGLWGAAGAALLCGGAGAPLPPRPAHLRQPWFPSRRAVGTGPPGWGVCHGNLRGGAGGVHAGRLRGQRGG